MDNIYFLSIPIKEIFGYFIIYSFLGWLSEVGFAYWKEKRFVNRGFLAGPYCPIYGFGVLLVLLFLIPVSNNIIFLFFGALFVTSVLEYITGYLLEKIFHAKWWDYSNEPYNLSGYVCLSFSVIWGVVASIVVLFIHPFIKGLIHSIPTSIVYTLTSFIFIGMTIDLITTVSGILKLNQLLRDLTEKLENIDKAAIKEKLIQEKREMVTNVGGVLNEKREDIHEILTEAKNKIKEFKVEYEELLQKRSFSHRRIIKAFPHLKIDRFKRALNELKKEINK
ncbi:hypothetical protein [Proteiniborus sp.]|uniref:putative ABC transporter permease n=1 Tax=Proteiniborus sp. TaxID=2079015 RepID=UPI003324B29A